jgi:hypothetical protein
LREQFYTRYLTELDRMYRYFWNQFLPELKGMKQTFSTPYIWNSKAQRFTLIRSLSYVKRFRSLSIIFALHLPLICWNLLQTFRNETNNFIVLYGLWHTAVTAIITVIRWMHQNAGGEIVQFLNSTVDFQKLHIRPGMNMCNFH